MAHEAKEAEEGRRGQISEQLNYLEQAIEQLAHAVRRVDDCLKPILRVEDEDEAKAVTEDKAFVPLADHVNALAVRVRRQSDLLSRIIQRLEL